MTRQQFMHAFDAVEPDPHERACRSPGRARRRHDLPSSASLGDGARHDFGDAVVSLTTGGIIRPDRRAPVRHGVSARQWIYDPIMAGA